MVLEAIKMKEEKDLFFNNKDEEKKLGCIGYLRGDFGGGGRECSLNYCAKKTLNCGRESLGSDSA